MAGVSWRIWVENRTDKEVLFVLSFDARNGKLHPSTDWPHEPTIEGYDIHRVRPQQRRPIDYPSQYVESHGNEEIAIFVFDPDTLAKYTWKQLEVDQNYLKKYICEGAEVIYP
jgi:hypothetical protein